MGTRSYHLVLMTALAATACTKPNNLSVQVTDLCFPPEDATKCGYDATCGRVTGKLGVDVAINWGLSTHVEVHNNMTNSDSVSKGANSAFVEHVEIACHAPGVDVGSIADPIQREVPANGTAVIGFDLLNADTAKSLAAGVGASGLVDVTCDVKLKGVLGDRVTEFETAEYPIPVEVCNGCWAPPTCKTDQKLTALCPDAGQWPATHTCE